MTDATVLTINDLTANGWTTKPAGDVFGTSTAAVTIYGTIDTKRNGAVIIEYANGDDDAVTVAALAGDNPPAQRAGLGNGTASIGAGTTAIFGPFETARFLQSDGTFGLTLTPGEGGTVIGTVVAYALPLA